MLEFSLGVNHLMNKPTILLFLLLAILLVPSHELHSITGKPLPEKYSPVPDSPTGPWKKRSGKPKKQTGSYKKWDDGTGWKSSSKVLGVLDKVEGKIATVRIARFDLQVDLSKLDAKTRAELLASKGKKFNLPIQEAVVKSRKVPNGIRADCTELPFSEQEIIDAGESDQVKNINDFLQQIPEGTLETFTLVFDSRSAQGVGVSKQWPRVIRSSADGKLTMSYTCNPNSPSYGSVEVLAWDEKKKKFNMTHIDLKKAKKPRHEKNPKSCMNCHSKGVPNDPKPIWDPYPEWKGVYGGFAERMSSSEQNSFKNFKKLQKDNPCYKLPWPKTKDKSYSNYPNLPPDGWSKKGKYRAQNEKKEPIWNMDLRANLKMTDNYSHLLAKRLARRIEQSPEYQKLKYLIMQDALGCDPSNIGAAFKAKGVKPYDATAAKDDISSRFDPRSSRGSPRLYQVAMAIGIKPSEWTMAFGKDGPAKGPEYRPAMSSHRMKEREMGIGEVVQGALLMGMAASDSDLKPFAKTGKGTSATFGKRHGSCVDAMGGEIMITKGKEKEDFCKLMKDKEAMASQKSTPAQKDKTVKDELKCPRGYFEVSGNENNNLTATMLGIATGLKVKKVKKKDLDKGKNLFASRCLRCHNDTSSYKLLDEKGNFNKQTIMDNLSVGTNIIDVVDSRLLEKKDMPRKTMKGKKALTDKERKMISNYLKDLFQKAATKVDVNTSDSKKCKSQSDSSIITIKKSKPGKKSTPKKSEKR